MSRTRAVVGLLAAVLAGGCRGGDGAGPPPPGLADPAAFTAVTRYEPACLCATVAGWVTDGVTRLDFSAPYSIIFGGVATFTGEVTTSPQSLPLAHVGVLPPLGDSTMSANARFAFLGD